MPALQHRAAHFILKNLGMFNRSYTEEAFGRRFVIPIINGRKTYVSEPWMAQMIAHLFRQKPGAFMDVGVNLGQTMLKVAAADPEREYLGFEPNPACADYAQTLITANNFPYAVVPAGLSVHTDILQLQIYRNEDTDPSASLVEGFREGAIATKPVVTVGLDDLPEGLLPKQVAIVKIDVEGGEAYVIEGIRSLLAEQRPHVLVEILPAYNADNSPRLEQQKKIEACLTDANYVMFRIRRHSDETLSTIERISEIGIHGDLALADYLMVPAEEADRVEASFS
ncbi:methyltransferase, FkbM family [Parasphingorhabdus marina DSM 22363]|uniref:Methyltransferase, FkbM family n=1 Tax=Parasphingorhabdus marina DSM 22363 TaxID=1123272 RepID=A0A1N6HCV1_9SPHN|nr:FkbM family methyltransferase [Parasphingorhabdus marina]SIO17661.1 methyltransferase, FkbM family [Parasphingorhabdus marina DSM 22363]